MQRFSANLKHPLVENSNLPQPSISTRRASGNMPSFRYREAGARSYRLPSPHLSIHIDSNPFIGEVAVIVFIDPFEKILLLQWKLLKLIALMPDGKHELQVFARV